MGGLDWEWEGCRRGKDGIESSQVPAISTLRRTKHELPSNARKKTWQRQKDWGKKKVGIGMPLELASAYASANSILAHLAGNESLYLSLQAVDHHLLDCNPSHPLEKNQE